VGELTSRCQGVECSASASDSLRTLLVQVQQQSTSIYFKILLFGTSSDLSGPRSLFFLVFLSHSLIIDCACSSFGDLHHQLPVLQKLGKCNLPKQTSKHSKSLNSRRLATCFHSASSAFH
jgi:hypothetical protein